MDPRYPSYPKATAAGRETALAVEHLEPHLAYTVRAFPKKQRRHVWERTVQADARGRAEWPETFPEPGEYLLDLIAPRAERPTTTARVFALPDDLAPRLPWRGDFHIHTHYSGGSQPQMSPTEFAVRGRELGLDVLAITDHDLHTPSLEAIAGVARLGLNLACLMGEEVSFADNWHMLAIGARCGISDLFQTDAAQAEVAALAASRAKDALAGGLRGDEYAPVRWVVDAIHRHGGRAFLAHPYWVSRRGFHLDIRLYDQLMADGVLDGVELLGDVAYEDNLLSVAHYQGLLMQGYRLPVIGCSDTHGTDHTFGCYWTMIWVAEPSGEGALRAIQDGYSVACSTVGPTGRHEGLRAYGAVRLVELALYLEREFFPLHDALCREEARLALETLFGETDRRAEMTACRARMMALYQHCFPSATAPCTPRLPAV